jgi:hypothetical protein
VVRGPPVLFGKAMELFLCRCPPRWRASRRDTGIDWRTGLSVVALRQGDVLNSTLTSETVFPADVDAESQRRKAHPVGFAPRRAGNIPLGTAKTASIFANACLIVLAVPCGVFPHGPRSRPTKPTRGIFAEQNRCGPRRAFASWRRDD